ncbi:TonB-dependent siderophore receptor [Pseudomonas sp. 148P]|uniref:TonB-dependent siderophore receptor n=1 Tax=Pseudomonas ulcerans TaxID=3115852 RepID=A0ABU7HQC5_9PSED|nr:MULTISPECIES: TonB-dependent siderophore receptor [unclassified Pseudomonas]MEE1922747.1 TonB-dependent siderophore receptor [Pseudomonas sp. 147P]MEE1933724.1 TonB-dependent siderophore receptor [Pseudomonas sp. 148P]
MHAARPQPFPFQPRSLTRAVCLALALAAVPAFADSAAPVAPAVAAGSLAQALSSFAERSGITLSYAPDDVRGLSTQGLGAGGSLEEGLAKLLKGSGLVAHKTASGFVVLRDSGADLQLEPTSVDSTALQSAFAPVDGYFASNASGATKSDKSILETAQSVSVVTAEQINDRKVNKVEDAVAYSAGVRVGSSGLDPRFDNIQVRGFETTIAADFLDGLRQPGSGWLSLYSTEAYALERIEVLKGPASVLYGQISPGGMVNRVSKRPSLLAKNEVQVQAGSYGHEQGQFDVGGKLDEAGDVLFRTVGLYRDSGYSVDQMDNQSRLLAPSLSWQIDPDTSLTLLAQYQERQTAASPMMLQEGDHLTDFWQGDEYYDKLHQRQWTFGYEFEHRFNDTFSVQQNLRYGQVSTTNQYLQPTALVDGHTLERYAVGLYEDMSSLTTDTRLVSRFSTGNLHHTVVSGIDYAWLDTSLLYAWGAAPSIDRWAPDYHQPVVKPTDPLADQDGLEHRMGAYVQDQIELDNWRLSAGLRRDWVHVRRDDNLTDINSTTSDSATTGQLGVLYLFDNGLAPYASYATSFLPVSGVNTSGQPYKPTEGEQFEVGLKYQPPGSRTLLTGSLYHLTQSNVQTRDLVNPLNNVQTGEQVSRGLELEAVSDVSDNLRLTASYAFNDAEVTKGNNGDQGKVPKNVARHLAALWLDYKLPFGVGVSGGARYTGSTYGDAANEVKNEGYTLVDAGVHYDFGGGLDGVRLALNARNLFDKRFINCQDGYCYRGEARSVVTSLSYRW